MNTINIATLTPTLSIYSLRKRASSNLLAPNLAVRK